MLVRVVSQSSKASPPMNCRATILYAVGSSGRPVAPLSIVKRRSMGMVKVEELEDFCEGKGREFGAREGRVAEDTSVKSPKEEKRRALRLSYCDSMLELIVIRRLVSSDQDFYDAGEMVIRRDKKATCAGARIDGKEI